MSKKLKVNNSAHARVSIVVMLSVVAAFLLSSVGTEARWTKTDSHTVGEIKVGTSELKVTGVSVPTWTSVNKRNQTSSQSVNDSVRNTLVAGGKSAFPLVLTGKSVNGPTVAYELAMTGTGIFANSETKAKVYLIPNGNSCSVTTTGTLLRDSAVNTVTVGSRNIVVGNKSSTGTFSVTEQLCVILSGPVTTVTPYYQTVNINGYYETWSQNFTGTYTKKPPTTSGQLTVKVTAKTI